MPLRLRERPVSRALLALVAVACSPSTPAPTLAPPPSPADAASPAKVGRHAVHGMIVFGGAGATYLTHIPMFRPPHDAQLVLEVARTDTAKSTDFGAELHTFEPKPVSLDDIIAG